MSMTSTVHRANASLEEACECMAPLTLQGLSFSWRQVHLGQGLYARGDGATTHLHEQLHLESIKSRCRAWSEGKLALHTRNQRQKTSCTTSPKLLLRATHAQAESRTGL